MGVDDPHQRLHLPTDGDESRDEARHGLDRVLLRHGETREDGPYYQLSGVPTDMMFFLNSITSGS